MSTEIIKSVTFNEKNRTIRVCSDSSNVSPKYYDPWYPVECGYDYDQWKAMFVGSLFGGMSRFQPSCKSKAKKAYDNVNRMFGLTDTKHGVWHEVSRMFPYDYDWQTETWKNPIDEEMKRRYDEFQEKWEAAYMRELNRLIGAPAK